MEIKREKWFIIPLLIVVLSLTESSCKKKFHIIKYISSNPVYNSSQLVLVDDTLHFPLDSSTFNSIESFNYFFQEDVEYISFYDERSQSVNIYGLKSKKLVKKILLKDLYPGERLHEVQVYAKNFDSIFVINELSINLYDSLGNMKFHKELMAEPIRVKASFENNTPPIFVGNILYTKAKPYLNPTSFKDLNNWAIIYDYNLATGNLNLQYNLPPSYRENIYGSYFFDYSYCYNNRGYFVFSFPADTNVYETNLTDYNVGYSCKSKYQKELIEPITKNDLTGSLKLKSYLTRASYGSIYFDSYTKRYLRVAKHAVTESDYEHNTRRKKQTILILNEQMNVIGESDLGEDVSYSSLFITRTGNIYARINSNDEYGIHFVRLSFRELIE